MQENFVVLYDRLKYYMSDDDIEEVNRAFLFASKAHESQIRKSGEPYISHPIAVAIILAKQKSPKEIIISGLLHDVVEDTDYEYEDIEENFSKEIADMVEGVTKLSEIEEYTYDQLQAANHRKIIISSAKDVRVILIKLADRLHNMRTLGFMNSVKQKLIANETLEVYAPIAHRLGMYEMKWELEDLSFKALNPEKYHEIAEKLEMKRSEREQIVEETLKYLNSLFEEKGLNAYIIGRSKHIYSIYRKISQGKDFGDIFDLFAFRIIVKTIPECYSALGIIHQHFKPIPLRFKDYIPTPKHNFYQSIHTTVLTKQGMSMEFQIRTEKMNVEAEYGIASHWIYKENGDDEDFQEKANQKLIWLRKILEEGDMDETNSQIFMNKVKDDYLSKSIIVFTPMGDSIELPYNSTVLDFAFYVHTDVGLSALSAKVNDNDVSLFYTLKMGEVVSIIRSQHAEPSLTWLSKVKTSRARESLRKYFKDEEALKIQNLGKKIFNDLGIQNPEINFKEFGESERMFALLEEFNISTKEDFFYDLGMGEIDSDEVVNAIKETKVIDTDKLKDIIVEDETEDYQVSVCKYCSPLPGDEIVATKLDVPNVNRYYVHRRQCEYATNRHEAAFSEHSENSLFVCRINITFDDRPKILSTIMAEISGQGYNITSIYGRGKLNGKGTCRVSFEIKNKKEYRELKKTLIDIDGIEDVERILPTK